MRILILIIFSVLIFQENGWSQKTDTITNPEFSNWIKKGEQAFQNKKYKTCASCYEKANALQPNNFKSKIKAAHCYALSRKNKKARQRLVEAVSLDWEMTEEYVTQQTQDFKRLKRKKRHWRKVEKALKNNQGNINVALRNELLEMYKNDQKYRAEINKVFEEKGAYTKEVQDLWKKQSEVDAYNIKRVNEIILSDGFPRKSIVGKKGIEAIFFIVQHAELEYQQKYLPKFQEAAKNGEMKKSTVAMMVDRVEMNLGRPQIYGSQISSNDKNEDEVYKILDERNVDKRRAAIGLPPMKEYAKRFGLEYKDPKPRKLTNDDFKKFIGNWGLINIRDGETFEIVFSPKKDYKIEFNKSGKLIYNLDVNTCKMSYQATDKGRLIFNIQLDCTEECCDDKEVRSILSFHKVVRFELYDKLLFLMDLDGKIWEYERRPFVKRKHRAN